MVNKSFPVAVNSGQSWLIISDDASEWGKWSMLVNSASSYKIIVNNRIIRLVDYGQKRVIFQRVITANGG